MSSSISWYGIERTTLGKAGSCNGGVSSPFTSCFGLEREGGGCHGCKGTKCTYSMSLSRRMRTSWVASPESTKSWRNLPTSNKTKPPCASIYTSYPIRPSAKLSDFSFVGLTRRIAEAASSDPVPLQSACVCVPGPPWH